MELELKRAELTGYHTVLETTLFSEETLECIVPDSCPDILRIVACDGMVCVKSREVEEGRAELRGTIHATVLYLPDGTQGLKHMEVTIPFLCSTEHGGIHKEGIFHVVPELLSAEARLLNPRKIYIRADIAVGVQFYAPSIDWMAIGFDGDDRWGIEEKKEPCRSYLVSAVQEKGFTYLDEVSLPGSKPDMEELLHQRVELLCHEYKVIGSKLIFKGQVLLKLLYKGTDNMLATAAFELPFSQIMEISQVCEEADCTLKLYLSDISCQPLEEDPRKIAVRLELMAQASLREEQTVELLTDLYSTMYQLEAESREEDLVALCEKGIRRVSVREVLEVPVAVKSVVDCWLKVGNVSQKQEGSITNLAAEVRATMLCTGEDDDCYAFTKPLTVDCQINAEKADRCVCSCQCLGELYATPTVGGIELRFPLDFEYRTEAKCAVKQVSAVHLEETQPVDTALRPSIVLRMAGEGETLWELAKAYATTKADILAANELSEEEDLVGRLLLIPKKR